MLVVDEHHTVADEDAVPDPDPGADEAMALNFAGGSDFDPRLNLGKGTDPGPGTDRASVEVGEGPDGGTVPEATVPDQAAGRFVCGPLEHRGSILAPDRCVHLRETISALESWGRSRGWAGPDPYEGLNATRGRRLARTPLGRRLLIQAVKRSPRDLRPALGIVPELDAATLAHVIRAHATAGSGCEPEIARLETLRCETHGGAGWGYHFDVETRFFFYGRGTPNTIATAFAGHALLDAHAATGSGAALGLAREAGAFFTTEVGLNETGDGRGFFGYFPGDRTPIHNASLLAASFLARLAAHVPSAESAGLETAVAAASAYALDHQLPDGSWYYADHPAGRWVDGFHTGYVLDALDTIDDAMPEAAPEGAIADSLTRGRRFYAQRLIEADGRPRFTVESPYPIDGQSAAQAIRSFALAGRHDPADLEIAWRVYGYSVAKLRRRDGAFLFQRGRLFANRIAHPRWVQAPMLEALCLLAALSTSPPAPEVGSA